MYTPLLQPESISKLLGAELPKNPSWIEPSILPKSGLMLFGGEQKIGKSFLMLELTRNLVLCERPFNHPNFYIPEACKVLMVEQELGPWGLQKRIKTAYAGIEKDVEDQIYYISQDPEFIIGDNPEVKKHLIKIIKDLGIGVVFLDPMNRLHAFDENNNQDVGMIFRILGNIINECRDLGTSIVFSHHFRKKPIGANREGYDILDPGNFSGSYKWTAGPDTLVSVHRHLEKEPMVNTEGHQMWELSTAWTIRQGEPVNEFSLTVNKDNDLRVKFRSEGRIKIKKKKKCEPPEDEDDPITGKPPSNPLSKLVYQHPVAAGSASFVRQGKPAINPE